VSAFLHSPMQTNISRLPWISVGRLIGESVPPISVPRIVL
jgi:hypothetical protein